MSLSQVVIAYGPLHVPKVIAARPVVFAIKGIKIGYFMVNSLLVLLFPG